MTLLVPFSGKYYRNGWKTRKASMAEWNWRQGLKGDCQTVAPKVSRPTAELAEERKSRFATQNIEYTLALNDKSLYIICNHFLSLSLIHYRYNFGLYSHCSKRSQVQIQIIHVLFLHKLK